MYNYASVRMRKRGIRYSVYLYVCVCVSVPVRVSIGFQSWILILGFAKKYLVLELCLALLIWNAIAAFSEECVAKLVHRALLLYLVVSSALER